MKMMSHFKLGDRMDIRILINDKELQGNDKKNWEDVLTEIVKASGVDEQQIMETVIAIGFGEIVKNMRLSLYSNLSFEKTKAIMQAMAKEPRNNSNQNYH